MADVATVESSEIVQTITEDETNLKRSADEVSNEPSKKAKVENESKSTTNEGKIRPRKFAILLSYCGAKYHGLQRNKPHETIEEALLSALHKAEIITDEQFERPQNMFFQRAARTDKGVSALKQTLSARLPEAFPDSLDKVNDLLPEDIRVIAAKRATKYFDAKNFCDARTYSYMMPTFTLAAPDQTTSEEFRLGKADIMEFNEILSKYIGTKNFHNFTSQKAYSDPSAVRFIISMSAGEPFIRDGLEFIVVVIKGQSFMLHQIRKMLGLAIAVKKGYASLVTLEKAFGGERLDIPKAPGLGLMLQEVHYERYSKRYGADGIHEPLVWEEYNQTLSDFRDKYIYPTVTETEKTERSMFNWLQTLYMHTYDTRRDHEPIGERKPIVEVNPLKAAALQVDKDEVEEEDDDKTDDEEVLDQGQDEDGQSDEDEEEAERS